jgi:predicted negative regulator of RcsB-dependent stress response
VVDQAEQEQIEEIRAWWDEYGNYIIAGVVIGALLLFGWNYYKTSKANAEIAASVLYDELADHVAEGRVEEAERVSGDLDASYPESSYSVQSKLAMARLYMDNNRDADAAAVLRELVDSNQSPGFAAVARLRLAKILHYQEKYEEVLALLDLEDTAGFTARYAEARGDALVALERFDEARGEYLVALADNGQTVDATFLQLKMMDLPLSTAGSAETDTAEDDGALELPATNTDTDTDTGGETEADAEPASAAEAEADPDANETAE